MKLVLLLRFGDIERVMFHIIDLQIISYYANCRISNANNCRRIHHLLQQEASRNLKVSERKRIVEIAENDHPLVANGYDFPAFAICYQD